MIKTNTNISNKLGLHARASAKLTKLAGSFDCEVWMSKSERRVNAKSIMGVMEPMSKPPCKLWWRSSMTNLVKGSEYGPHAGRFANGAAPQGG